MVLAKPGLNDDIELNEYGCLSEELASYTDANFFSHKVRNLLRPIHCSRIWSSRTEKQVNFAVTQAQASPHDLWTPRSDALTHDRISSMSPG